MEDLMREFNCSIVGNAFVMSTELPQKKEISDYVSLMTLNNTDSLSGKLLVKPANWLVNGEKDE